MKIIGKVKLESMNLKTRSRKKTKEEKRAERIKANSEWKVEEYNAEKEMRDRLATQMDNWRPQCYGTGIATYNDCDFLRFNLNDGSKGLAIGCLDPLKQTIGYYIAIGLYGPTTITKRGDILEDGTEAGTWPETVRSVNAANDTDMVAIQAFLYPQIEQERKIYREQMLDEFVRLEEIRLEQIRKEEEARKAKEEAIARVEEQKRRLMAEMEGNEDNDLIRTEEYDMMHLPLFRHEKQLRDSEWPRVDAEIPSLMYFESLRNMSQMITDSRPSVTYPMSKSYVEYMIAHKDEYLDKMVSVRHLLSDEKKKIGVMYYYDGECEMTVPYSVIIHNNNKEVFRFVVIRDGQMICSYSHSIANAVANPSASFFNLVAKSDPEQSMIRLKCNTIKELICVHLMMEKEINPEYKLALSGVGGENGDGDMTVITPSDIQPRTAEWFTTVTVPGCQVDEYDSHRWIGHGDEKELVPVKVSGYTKGSYTRKAAGM